MNENSTERSRGRRRGGRRRSSNRRGEPRNETRNETRTTPATAKQPKLWQKIVAFFTGKSKSNGSSANAQPARKYPAYEPRSQQHKRFEDGAAASTQTAESPRPSRKPEAVEVTTPKLYVGNLSFDAGESDLFDLFNGVGKVQNAEIVAHRETEKSKGFGFVTMNSIEEAKRAVSELHDKEFMGRKLVVSGAKTPPDR
jgi:RNA recognition motif-containing protein